MARSIIELILKASGGASASKQVKQLNKGINDLDSAFSKLGFSLGLAGVTAGVVEFGRAAFDASGRAERLTRANTSLAASLDTTSQAMVQGIVRASGATIDRLTALEASNKAMMFGVVESQGQMEELTRIAVTLGAAMGQDATKSLDDLTVALGRQSPMILDNLGITLKLEEAYRIYATSLGKSVEALTEQEKKQAFVNAALQKGRQRVEQLGGVTVDQLGKVEQLHAAWSDFTVSFGQLVDGPLAGGVELATELVRKLEEGAIAWQGVFENMERASQLAEKGQTERALERQLQLLEDMRRTGAGAQAIANQEAVIARLKEDLADATEQEAQRAGVAKDTASVYGEIYGLNRKLTQEQQKQLSLQGRLRDIATQRAIDEAKNRRILADEDRSAFSGGFSSLKRSITEVKDAQAEAAKAAEESAETFVSSYNAAADRLRGLIDQQIQPSLSEVWQAPADDRNIDEWARRAATLATQGLNSEWIGQLQQQFGGMSFWEPIAQAIQSGDDAALREAATNLLSGPGVMQLWDKELIKQRVRESLQQQNMREELIGEIFRELSAEGLNVDIGDVQAAAGGTPIAGGLIGGIRQGIPDAIAEQDLGGDIVRQIESQMASNEKSFMSLAETLAKGLNDALPAAIGSSADAFLDALTSRVADRLGLAGVRP